ncbi:MAG: type II toxin-antitoxin system VapC family toxin [Gammaproteobacteria bacterium]
MKVVIDTNILVDYLHRSEAAREELARYDAPGISLITWMEVLIGAKDKDDAQILRGFTLPIENGVAELAVELRRTHRIRLPDAIIWATARSANRLLVTRNTRDFPATDPGVRVPYER